MIDQQRLKELLHYDPVTGDFTWLPRTVICPHDQRFNTRFVGKMAGSIRRDGYRVIRADDQLQLAHRLAFLYMVGRWPHHQIDHINHTRGDNRWINLREVSGLVNRKNMGLHKSNTSGHVGVNWSKAANSWRAYITINNKQQYLGCFADFGDAIQARKDAERQFGFHPNHGS